jgi:O-antigen biosynthesis protein
MLEKPGKFIHYTRTKGLKQALRVSRDSLLKNNRTASMVAYRTIDVMVDVADVKSADFIHAPYSAPKSKSKKASLKIGWVLSPISAGSGGQNTITRFVRHLQSAGHDITIYLYEGIHPQRAQDAQAILAESFNTNVTVKKIADYTECDAIIATGWETAYPVFNLKTDAFKMYFVQDFEPYFYGLGSRSVLAENTYRFNFYGITAGKWLTHKVSSEYGMRADYFDFGVDVDIYKPKVMPKKKKKICFYARPVTERRAFEVGIIALDIFHQKHPEYEIEFFGWDVSDFKIPFPYKNRGILSHSELAELYQSSVACLVLSLTNVSLLPMELLASGCTPVMNNGDNNKMVLGKNKYIEYTGVSPIELAAGLSRAVEQKDIQKIATEASNSVKSRTWDASYKKVEKLIIDCVNGR